MQENQFNNEINQPYIRLAEAERFVPYSKDYLSLLARQGKIHAKKIGRDWHTTREAIEQYHAEQEARRNVLNTGRPLGEARTQAGYPANELRQHFAEESPVVAPQPQAQQYFAESRHEASFVQPAAPVGSALTRETPSAAPFTPSPAPSRKGFGSLSLAARIAVPLAALMVIFGGVRLNQLDEAVYGVKDFVAVAQDMQEEFVRVIEGKLLRVDEGGNLHAKGNVNAGGQLVSNIVDGVAPLVVRSSTTVSNLSTEYLDGIRKGDISLAFVVRNGATTATRVVLNGGADISDLVVSGTANVAALIADSLTAEKASIGTADIDQANVGELTVSGDSALSDTEINGTLDVSGTANLRRANVNGRLSVDGALSVAETLSARTVNAGGGTFNNIDVENILSFSGSETVNLYKKIRTDEAILATDAGLEVAGNTTLGGMLSLAGDFVPASDNTHSIGSAELRWEDIFLGPLGASIYNANGTDAEYVTIGYQGNVFTVESIADGAGTARNFNLTGGMVGIGTADPQSQLHVNGVGSFGDAVTVASATRALNLISSDATMRVWRKSDAPADDPAVELITSAAGSDIIDHRWDFFLQKNSGSFAIRQREYNQASVTVNRLLIDGATGQVRLPATGATAGLLIGGDASLYRSAANVLRTDSTFIAAGQLQLPTTGSSAGILLGGDVNLYRTASNRLNLGDDDILTFPNRASANDVAIESAVSGDAFYRFQVTADGTLQWGPGNALRDTNLYRDTFNTLRTDDSFEVGGDLTVTGDLSVFGITANNGDVVLGDTAADTVTFVGVVNSNILPDADVTRDLGSLARQWNTVYADTVTASNLAGTVVTGDTSSASWLINSDNATANTEVSTLAFDTGSNPFNATVQWNAAGDAGRVTGFDDTIITNYPLAIYSEVSGGNQTFTSGTLFSYSQPAAHAITQSGAFTGINLDFSSNITNTTNNQTGIALTLKDGSVSGTATGLSLAGTADYGINLSSATIGTAAISLPTGTAAAQGIDFGGDVNLYRSAANTLRTDDSLIVGTNLTVSGTFDASSSSGSFDSLTIGGGFGSTGVTISSAGAISADSTLTVAGADAYLQQNVYIGANDSYAGQAWLYGPASGSTGGIIRIYHSGDYDTTYEATLLTAYQDDLLVERWDGQDLAMITAEGQLQAPITGSSAGLLIGGDVQLYRSAADVLFTPDQIETSYANSSALKASTATAGSIGIELTNSHSTLNLANRSDLSGGFALRLNATTDLLQVSTGGQLALPVTGSSAGIMLGGDAGFYRSGANQVSLFSGDELLWAGDTSIQRVLAGTLQLTGGTANQLLVGTDDSVSGALIAYGQGTLQQNGGSLRLHYSADYDTSIDYSEIVAYEDDVRFLINNTTEAWRVNNVGQFQLPVTGSTGGLLIGGDTQLYRSSADVISAGEDDLLRVFSGGGGSVLLSGAENRAYIYADAGGNAALTSQVYTDSDARFVVYGNGAVQWGSGSATPDVQLSRGAANRLDLASGDSLYLTDGALGIGSVSSLLTRYSLIMDRDFSSTTASGSIAQVGIRGEITATGGTLPVSGLEVTPSGTVINSGGAHNLVTSAYLSEPTITLTSGSVTNAATLYVANAPTEGSSGNYALFVDAGDTRLDGTLTVGTGDGAVYAPNDLELRADDDNGDSGSSIRFYNDGAEAGRFTGNDLYVSTKLYLPTAGSSGGLFLGGDAQLYRGAADRLDLASGDDFVILNGDLRFGTTSTGIRDANDNELLTFTVGSASALNYVDIQNAGNNTSVKWTATGDDTNVTWDFRVKGTSAAASQFRWYAGEGSTQLAVLDAGGQLELPITGSSAGLLIGGDTQLYRGAANRLDVASGDDFNIVSGELTVTSPETTGTSVSITANSLTTGRALVVSGASSSTVGAETNVGAFNYTASPSTSSASGFTSLRGVVTTSAGSNIANNITGIYGATINTSTSGTVNLARGVLGQVLAQGAGGTISKAYAINADNPYITAGTITDNYGLFVNDQTAGTNDYGVAIAGADTQALWIGSGANNTDAANGIAFGSSRDTNLYRSGANTLRTDDSLVLGGAYLQTPASTNLILNPGADGFVDVYSGTSTKGLRVVNTSYSGTVITLANTGDITATGELLITSSETIGDSVKVTSESLTSGSALDVDGTSGYVGSFTTTDLADFTYLASPASASTNYWTAIQAKTVATTEHVDNLISGVYGIAQNTSTTGSLPEAWGVRGQVHQTGVGGTITNAVAFRASDAFVGAGTITNNFGLYVDDQTAGTNDYGIYISGADTQALWVGAGADNTDAANGIAFGASRDVNLYRAGSNLLNTDDNFQLRSGTLYVGVDDNTRGTLNILGHSSGETGATLRFHMSADYDGTEEYWSNWVYQDDLYWSLPSGTLARFDNTGAFNLYTQGSSGGLYIGGDFQIYRLGADFGYTPDTFQVGGAFQADGIAYFPATGSGGGLRIGGDTDLYRAAANVLGTSDSLAVTGVLQSGGTTTVAYNRIGDADTANNATAINGDDDLFISDSLELGTGGTINFQTFSTIVSTAGVCHIVTGTVTQLGDCNGAPTDLAENFGTTDPSIEAADIVSSAGEAQEVTVNGTPTSKAYVQKAVSPYESGLIGVVSTSPNQVYGNDGLFTESDNPRPVSLAGRVPVKVTTQNGAIKTGDAITSSDIPGVGMKASQAGRIVGLALSSYENEDTTEVGTVIVFVNPTWWSPSEAGLALLQQPAEGGEEGTVQEAIQTVATSVEGLATATVDGVKTFFFDGAIRARGAFAGLFNVSGERIASFATSFISSIRGEGDIFATTSELRQEASADGTGPVQITTYSVQSSREEIMISGTGMMRECSSYSAGGVSGCNALAGKLGFATSFAPDDVAGIVAFAPEFSALLDEGEEVRVIVTPTDELFGTLYVAEKSVRGFVVGESITQDVGVTFDWVIIARIGDGTGVAQIEEVFAQNEVIEEPISNPVVPSTDGGATQSTPSETPQSDTTSTGEQTAPTETVTEPTSQEPTPEPTTTESASTETSQPTETSTTEQTSTTTQESGGGQTGGSTDSPTSTPTESGQADNTSTP